MRKILSILLVLATLMAMAACGKNQTLPAQTAAPETTTQTTAPTQIPSPDHTHSYTPLTTDPTCVAAGFTAYTCTCGDSYVSDEVAALGHSFGQWETTLAPTETATGTAQRSCTVCLAAETRVLGMVITNHTHSYEGKVTAEATCTAEGVRTMTCACGESYTENITALGHNYNSNGKCTRCGAADPNKPAGPGVYTVTVRGENNALSGVTVTVLVNDTQVATGVTNNKGVAKMELSATGSGYKILLSNVPAGYGVSESYSFSSTTVSINLKSVPVLDPNDHSKAKYTVGSTMANFVLTDTDGNTYDLEQLRREKKLIILDFWYVNCDPCKKEFPYFEQMLQQYGDDVILLAVNSIDSEAKIKELRETLNADPNTTVSFPMLKDTLGITKGFGVSTYPVTVFIDPNGKIVNIHKNAYSSAAAFLAQVEKYMK